MQGLGVSQMVLIALLVALLNLNAGAATEVPRPLGVSLAKASLYQPRAGDNSWTCLDGSRSIPFSQVNDDYCDCADGSDEPGTSACPKGQFHCLNKGHQSVDIPSSQVQDGICDCCDGSDEAQVVGCPNTCLELGAAAAVQRRNEAELHKRGAERRLEMITRGKQLRAEREARRLELEQRRKEQELLRSEKEQLKKTAEALESDAGDVATQIDGTTRALQGSHHQFHQGTVLDTPIDILLALEAINVLLALHSEQNPRPFGLEGFTPSLWI